MYLEKTSSQIEPSLCNLTSTLPHTNFVKAFSNTKLTVNSRACGDWRRPDLRTEPSCCDSWGCDIDCGFFSYPRDLYTWHLLQYKQPEACVLWYLHTCSVGNNLIQVYRENTFFKGAWLWTTMLKKWSTVVTKLTKNACFVCLKKMYNFYTRKF